MAGLTNFKLLIPNDRKSHPKLLIEPHGGVAP
jgi:hypothetical protein